VVHAGDVTGELSETVQIVPGVVGPAQIIRDDVVPTPDGSIELRLDIRFDPQRGRYVCQEFRAVPGTGLVTTDALRRVTIADWIRTALLLPGNELQELPNPDGKEPWGLKEPDDVTVYGPTDRALQWTAHFYRLGLAVEHNPTKLVEQALGLPRSTVGRWIAAARSAGHLGPSEGVGKAGG
jgi:hypothetical protein